MLRRFLQKVAVSARRVRFERFPATLSVSDLESRVTSAAAAELAGRDASRGLLEMFVKGVPALRNLDADARDRFGAVTERLLRREVRVGGGTLRLADPVNWHRDPHFGIEWPRRYVRVIPDFLEGSDLVLLFHLNKMQFLLDYAGAFVATADERLRGMCWEYMESWHDQNPYRVGINWRSALEVGIRMTAWSMCLREIGVGVASDEQAGKIVSTLVRHAEHVAGHLSEHELANNHLIGEAATLYGFGAMWPMWASVAEWKTRSEEILTREARRQVLADGMDYENALNYHLYVLDFLLFYLSVKAAEDSAPPPEIVDAASTLARGYVSFVSPGGRCPRFGDDSISEFFVLEDEGSLGDEALADPVRLETLVKREFASTLARSPWGRELLSLSAPLVSRRRFADSGFAVWRGGRSHVVYAAGPQHDREFRSGHLHSDAGSFELELDGMPVLIDSGTYLYYYDADARDHFRGASAHNTALIDGVDPMEPGRTFEWRNLARNRTVFWHASEAVSVVSSDRSLRNRMNERFLHRRILIELACELWLVADRLGRNETSTHREGTSEVALYLHTALSPGALLRDGDERVRLMLPGGQTLFALAAAQTPHRMEVLADPADRRTWFSPRYGELAYGTTLKTTAAIGNEAIVMHAAGRATCRVEATTFTADGAELTVALSNGRSHRVRVSFAEPRVDLDGHIVENMM